MKHRAEKTDRAGAQLAMLEELKQVAVQLGFQVREEKLLREVGYHVRSGGCRLRNTNLILLDRQASPNARLDVLVDVLATMRLDDVYLSPAARELLDRAVSGADGIEVAAP